MDLSPSPRRKSMYSSCPLSYQFLSSQLLSNQIRPPNIERSTGIGHFFIATDLFLFRDFLLRWIYKCIQQAGVEFVFGVRVGFQLCVFSSNTYTKGKISSVGHTVKTDTEMLFMLSNTRSPWLCGATACADSLTSYRTSTVTFSMLSQAWPCASHLPAPFQAPQYRCSALPTWCWFPTLLGAPTCELKCPSSERAGRDRRKRKAILDQ